MRSIGVRELRQNASKYLRLVEQGETIEVTDRGRPVAHLTPVEKPKKTREQEIVDDLKRRGLLIPAKEPWSPVGVPAEPQPGKPKLSEILAEMREGERY